MKTKKRLKHVLLISTLVIAGMLTIGTTTSKAVLQANPTTHANPLKKVGSYWITGIRQMETTGQTMGLTETLDGLNTLGEDNGIDVHMMLPTEQGAIGILAISGYGNPNPMKESNEDVLKRTTTGNGTGIYYTCDKWECVASTKKFAVSKYNSDISPASGSITDGSLHLSKHGEYPAYFNSSWKGTIYETINHTTWFAGLGGPLGAAIGGNESNFANFTDNNVHCWWGGFQNMYIYLSARGTACII